jgi:predicted DNA-binding protein with PD1-like motif
LKITEGKIGRTFLVKLDTGEDLYKSVQEMAEKNNIKAGFFFAFGALSEAYFQTRVGEELKYVHLAQEGLQLTSCLGNFQMQEGKVKVHAHMNVAQVSGKAWGGHVLDKNMVSHVGEILVIEFESSR